MWIRVQRPPWHKTYSRCQTRPCWLSLPITRFWNAATESRSSTIGAGVANITVTCHSHITAGADETMRMLHWSQVIRQKRLALAVMTEPVGAGVRCSTSGADATHSRCPVDAALIANKAVCDTWVLICLGRKLQSKNSVSRSYQGKDQQ